MRIDFTSSPSGRVLMVISEAKTVPAGPLLERLQSEDFKARMGVHAVLVTDEPFEPREDTREYAGPPIPSNREYRQYEVTPVIRPKFDPCPPTPSNTEYVRGGPGSRDCGECRDGGCRGIFRPHCRCEHIPCDKGCVCFEDCMHRCMSMKYMNRSTKVIRTCEHCLARPGGRFARSTDCDHD